MLTNSNKSSQGRTMLADDDAMEPAIEQTTELSHFYLHFFVTGGSFPCNLYTFCIPVYNVHNSPDNVVMCDNHRHFSGK